MRIGNILKMEKLGLLYRYFFYIFIFSQFLSIIYCGFFQLFFKYLHGKDWRDVLRFDSNMIMDFAEKKKLFFDTDFSVNCKVMLTAVTDDDMIPLVDIRIKEMIDVMPHAIIHIFKHGKHPAMLSNKKEYRKLVCRFLYDN